MAFDGTYPCAPGNKKWSMLDVPIASLAYTVFTPVNGGNPTGGILLLPGQFGLVNIEFAWAMGNSDGNYAVQEYLVPFAQNQGVGGGGASAGVVLSLYNATSGAQIGTSTLPSTAGFIRVFAYGN